MSAEANTKAYPIDDISTHEQSSSGIAYVHTFDSGLPGPDKGTCVTPPRQPPSPSRP
ncbi:hypothetical protein BCh11DRAFT_01785 [Burkholderia sp. Ch1-1]|nr:hypothetical protein BCh11DRAFT_01785 [Burkholderia sp. Ch1-1]